MLVNQLWHYRHFDIFILRITYFVLVYVRIYSTYSTIHIHTCVYPILYMLRMYQLTCTVGYSGEQGRSGGSLFPFSA